MQIKGKLTASPLNYIGGKYKLLPQILPLFPDKTGTFVDLFCGGCNVGVNVNADKIICNDSNENLIGLLRFFKEHDFNALKSQIEKVISKYSLSNSAEKHYSFYGCDSSSGLGNYNRRNFLKLRTDFNALSKEDDDYYLYLYVLIIYSFNNQMRFNSDGKFNLPVGKRDFNIRMQNKLKDFIENIKKITFLNNDFESFNLADFSEEDFFYADPPYLITNATYNEKNGWNESEEKRLLKFLDLLDSQKMRFALSNVLSSNGKDNAILKEWLGKNKNYVCHHLDFSYRNSNYHKKIISEKTDEVLITNYRSPR